MSSLFFQKLFPRLDRAFRKVDRTHIRRTRNIRHIPEYRNRRGGKLSYAEWAHVIGIFQTLMYQNLSSDKDPQILDVGCGTGLLGLAAEPLVGDHGRYTGIDVMANDIKFCRQHFSAPAYEFIHFEVANPSYASTQPVRQKPWPVNDSSYDLVTALSVWTHLGESDARYYLKETARVLKKGGRAIITFFYLDREYKTSLAGRNSDMGRFHATPKDLWVFETPAYESEEWRCTAWSNKPEDAIGITPEGMESMVADSGLKQLQLYPGNWKERSGVYFQDVMIFEKC